MKVYAAPIDLGQIGGTGLGVFGSINFGTDGTTALTKISGAVSSIIGVMTVAAGIWFVFQFLTGGFHWISAGGDKTKLEEARHRISNAGVGLIIVVAGWSILAVAGQFFGWDILIANPGAIINSLGVK